MLQQTQVDRVQPYYFAWLERWPTIEALAAATPAQVIQQWAGLGYNRRAVSLLRTAQQVCERYGGVLPADQDLLRELPGIGGYTASAIACFALEQPTLVFDTNIARVIARLILGEPSHRIFDYKQMLRAGNALMPPDNPRDHNLALMDHGAMICTARSPKCLVCPVMQHCRWRIAGSPPEPSTASSVKFEDTARFARGRIVDALRKEPMSESALEAMLPEQHRPNLETYLAALAKDGLIEQAAAQWQLAGFTAE